MTPPTQYIIIADGQGTRWGDYRGTPKHLVNVEGEILLERTVNQFLPHGQVHVVGPDSRYHVPGSWFYIPTHDPELLTHEADRFACHKPIWYPESRINFLFGDVWFSERAVELISQYNGPWTWFSRFGPSSLHGCPYGEGFGFSIPADFQDTFWGSILDVINMKRTGELHKNQGWQLYRYMSKVQSDRYVNGGMLRKHRDYGNRVEINDWTDDFDAPADLIRWEGARLKASYPR